ncbi:Uncharacterised protein [uncultured archaeon]|nr:Uncharacterised protein [uncultured archaeon]
MKTKTKAKKKQSQEIQVQQTPQSPQTHQSQTLQQTDKLSRLAAELDSYIEADNYEKALDTIHSILQITPDDEKTLLLKVQLLLISRKLRDADKTIDRVLELYPKNHHAYLTKAIVTALYTSDIKEAVSFIDRGLEIKQDCFELLIAKAQMLYWLGDVSYNAWIGRASRIDSERAEKFLVKYWVQKPPTPVSEKTMQVAGLIQKLMFIISQQKYGGWKDESPADSANSEAG